MLVALVGVVVFLAEKLQSALPAAGVGDLLSLIGAFFFAAYSVAQKPLLDRYAVPVMMAHTCTLGAFPVLLLAWPAALAQDWTRVSPSAWVSLAWTIVVGTMDNFLRPILIKKGADLPLLLIFAGVIGGLMAFGLIGIFVGPVVLAVGYTLLLAWMGDEHDTAKPDGREDLAAK